MNPRKIRPRVTRELRGLVALDMIRRYQITVEPFGDGWRIFGRGVDLLVSEMAEVEASDLTPWPHPAGCP